MKLDSTLNCQLTLFGNYEQIAPTTEILTFLMKEFNSTQMIPSVFQEPTAIGNTVPRVQLRSIDGTWVVNFGLARIDVRREFGMGNFDDGQFYQFLLTSNIFLNSVSEKFSIKHQRVGIVVNYLLPELGDLETDAIYKKFSNPIDFYKEDVKTEWNFRVGKLSNVDLNGEDYRANVITEVAKIVGKVNLTNRVEILNRILIGFDINTHQDSTEFKLGEEEIIRFVDFAEKTVIEVLSNILTLLK